MKYKPGVNPNKVQYVTVKLVKLASILLENHPKVEDQAIFTFDQISEEVRLQDKTRTVLIDQISQGEKKRPNKERPNKERPND